MVNKVTLAGADLSVREGNSFITHRLVVFVSLFKSNLLQNRGYM